MSMITEEKATLRKKIRGQMRRMDPSLRAESDSSICQRVSLLSQFQLSETIFCFVGIGWEINTRPLILNALNCGKRVAIPLCTAPGIMEARLIDSLEHLKPGAYGIPEPSLDSPICPFTEIDFAIVPCVACDSSCMRLGQGGGFYDQFMAKYTVYTAALCRDEALLEKVPTEAWDYPVDCVVTESQTYFLKH